MRNSENSQSIVENSGWQGVGVEDKWYRSVRPTDVGLYFTARYKRENPIPFKKKAVYCFAASCYTTSQMASTHTDESIAEEIKREKAGQIIRGDDSD